MATDRMVEQYVFNMDHLQYVRGALKLCDEIAIEGEFATGEKRMQETREILIKQEHTLHQKQVELQKRGVSHLRF